MGLLTKTNPKANWRSVVRSAVVTSFVGSSLYASILWWNDWWMDWPLKLCLCAALMLFVGGLGEWQVAEDEDETESVEPREEMDSRGVG